MVLHEDTLKSFIPKGKIQFVVLGTMVAINGRTIDGTPPEGEFFYYNNNRNHFWRVLQYLVNPRWKKTDKAPNLTIKSKKQFLEKHGIAIINLVSKVTVPNKDKADPSDTVLFAALKKDNIEFKKLSPKAKKAILKGPLFFTCRRKKGIELLFDGFCQENGLAANTKENVWYWPTPTRCNPYDRSVLWRKEMQAFLKS